MPAMNFHYYIHANPCFYSLLHRNFGPIENRTFNISATIEYLEYSNAKIIRAVAELKLDLTKAMCTAQQCWDLWEERKEWWNEMTEALRLRLSLLIP